MENPRIGICQSKIVSKNNPNIIDAIGISIDELGDAYQIGYNEVDNGQYDIPQDIFGACACSALYRVELLKQIGLFDPDFFAYYEDVDLSWRARIDGWESVYVPTSIVYHIHSASGSKVKNYYLSRNKLFYLMKNAPFYLVGRRVMSDIYEIIMTLIFEKSKTNKLMLINGKFDSFLGIYKMYKKRNARPKKQMNLSK